MVQRPKSRCGPWDMTARGGASFTHEWRNRNFLSLLKDIWFQEHKYSSVTLVWAGNDLASRWSAPDTFAHAVGVWATLRRSHPSRGCSGGEIPVLLIIR